MNLSHILKIMEKESRTLLRNKRILFGFIAPFFLLPILLYGYNYFSVQTESTIENTLSNIYIEGDLPSELMSIFLESDTLNILRKSEADKGLDILISERKVDLVLVYTQKRDAYNFLLRFDYGRSSGTRASDRVMLLLDQFEDSEKQLILQRAHIDFGEIKTKNIISVDLASEEEVTGRALGEYIPLLVVLYTFMMILNFSIELTTSEKESETLETLFSVPITKVDMVLGKLFSCILFSIVSTGFILMGIYIMLPLFVDMDTLGFSLSIELLLNIFVTILPLLFIGSALSIAVGMFASSYKESGAYSTPLIFIFLIPAYVGSSSGIELNAIVSMIPIVNATLLIKEALINRFDFGFFSIAFFINLLFSVISLSFMFKVFKTENLLFGSGKELSFRFQRKYIQMKQTVESGDVFMGLSVIIVLYIYLSVLLPKFISFEGAFYISQYGVFLLAPILLIWYLKAEFRTSMGLNLPSFKGVMSGGSFWISALCLSLIYQLSISKIITDVPSLNDLQIQLENWSMWKQFVFIALTPAICEEVLFRGFALRPLEKAYGAKWAVVITALAFAIVHLDFVRLVPTFALGLAFGYTAVKTRSLLPSMVLHLLNNSFALFAPESIMLEFWQLLIILIVTLFLGWGFGRQRKRSVS